MIKEKIKNNKFLYKLLYPLVYRVRYFIHADCRTALFFLKYFLRKIGIYPYDKELVDLENKYKGKRKRVFVVATGPSLRVEDLEWLEKTGEISIACNGIFRLYDKTKWRPDYYFINDDRAYRDDYVKMNENFCIEANAKKLALIPEDCKRDIKYKIDKKRLAFVPVCYHDHWVVRPGKRCKYSSDMKNICNDLYTVTNSMIALADYMGFEEIYLIGVDCNYYGNQVHAADGESKSYEHMDEKEKASYIGETELNFQIGFREAKRGAEQNGKRVYNATRGGSLEVFERVKMDDIIDGKW